MVLVSHLFCMVLDHFMSMVTPSLQKKRSPMANCLVGSNDLVECGKRLETLKNEKNVTILQILYGYINNLDKSLC